MVVEYESLCVAPRQRSEEVSTITEVCAFCDRVPEFSALTRCYKCGRPVCADCLVVVQVGDEFKDSCPVCVGLKVRAMAARAAASVRKSPKVVAYDKGWDTRSEEGTTILAAMSVLGVLVVGGLFILLDRTAGGFAGIVPGSVAGGLVGVRIAKATGRW